MRKSVVVSCDVQTYYVLCTGVQHSHYHYMWEVHLPKTHCKPFSQVIAQGLWGKERWLAFTQPFVEKKFAHPCKNGDRFMYVTPLNNGWGVIMCAHAQADSLFMQYGMAAFDKHCKSVFRCSNLAVHNSILWFSSSFSTQKIPMELHHVSEQAHLWFVPHTKLLNLIDLFE